MKRISKVTWITCIALTSLILATSVSFSAVKWKIPLPQSEPQSDIAMSFLRTQGRKIVDESGKEVHLRGIQHSFGSFRGEGDGEVSRLNPEMEAIHNRIIDRITEEDFDIIQEMGANAIRLSLLTYEDFVDETSRMARIFPFLQFYKEENFERLDRVMEWAQKRKIYVLISMRQSFGGHNPSPHSGNQGRNQHWENPRYQRKFASLWKKIAARYADNPAVLGYNIFNEPYAPNMDELNRVTKNIIEKIRQVDKKHMIFLDGNRWGIDTAGLYVPINGVVSVHFYFLGSYAVHGEGTYPSVVNGFIFDKISIEAVLEKRIEPARQQNVPVMVTEFGAKTEADNFLEYDQDVIDSLEKFDLPWIYYNLAVPRPDRGTQAIYYLDANNQFYKMLSEISKNNRPIWSYSEREWEEAIESLKIKYSHVKEDLRYLLINAMSQ